MRPDDRKYLKSHEWCKVDGNVATMGITDYAVSHLSDLVFLDLPEVGTKVTAGKSYAEIESVKAVSDIYSAVTGDVIEVNEALPDQLDTLKDDPWKAGWMVKVRFTAQTPDLLDAAAYERVVAAESH
jgi:glycine cleavage system H protein